MIKNTVKEVKRMEKNTTIIGILGFILGVLLMLVINSNSKPQMVHMDSDEMMMSSNKDDSMHGAMNMMTDALAGKTGDDFDKAFLSEMIVHHEGAVEMADQALKNASHQDLKDMATAIIEAQTKEIEQMKQWQNEWGYEK